MLANFETRTQLDMIFGGASGLGAGREGGGLGGARRVEVLKICPDAGRMLVAIYLGRNREASSKAIGLGLVFKRGHPNTESWLNRAMPPKSTPERRRGRAAKAAAATESAPEPPPGEGAAPQAKQRVRKQVGMPVKAAADTVPASVRESGAEMVLYNRLVLKSTLEMLQSRSNKYEVDNLLTTLERDARTARDFQIAILHPNFINFVRDLIASSYTKRALPSIRVMMSLLVPHRPRASDPPDAPRSFTAVFFAERKAHQVSKRLVEIFFKTLESLKSSAIKVTEAIFVTPVPFSHESEAQVKSLGSGCCFPQIFRDEEVLSPATECDLSPKVRILAKEESKEFFAQNPNYRPENMEQRHHTDALMKYLGARPGTVAELLRPPIAALNLRRTELLYVWIH